MNPSEAARAAAEAVADGRIHGKYRCTQCGMRSNTHDEALACCRGLGPSASEKVAESRFERPE